MECDLSGGTAPSPSALRHSLIALRGLHPLAVFLFRLQSPEEAFQAYHVLLLCVKMYHNVIAYPLLRVEIQEVEIERVRGFPPRLLRPASVEPFDLEIHGHLCPSRTAKAADLTKLAT